MKGQQVTVLAVGLLWTGLLRDCSNYNRSPSGQLPPCEHSVEELKQSSVTSNTICSFSRLIGENGHATHLEITKVKADETVYSSRLITYLSTMALNLQSET